MKKHHLLFTLILTYFAIDCRAQWETITSFNQVINDLCVYDGQLYIGGGFLKHDGHDCYWSASYDGNTITRNTTLIAGGGIRSLDVFNGNLYAVGSMQHWNSIGVSVWNGNGWDNGGSTNVSHSLLYADGNDLYVGGDDGLIRKKTVDGSFETFLDFEGVGGVSEMIRYNDQLIFAGGFSNIGGVTAKNIAQWDGNSWSALGSGIEGATWSVEVYKNELYVCGTLTEAGGQAVSKIARWNGTSWSDVGEGVTGTAWNGLRDMTVFNNELYLVGDFDEVGHVISQNVIKWDGTEWKACGFEIEDSFPSSIEVYNNKIYVGIYDFTESKLYMYSGPFDINEYSESIDYSIFPNPVNDKFIININNADAKIKHLDVLNSSGKEQLIEQNGNQINISSLAGGIYFVKLSFSNGEVRVTKIIKN